MKNENPFRVIGLGPASIRPFLVNPESLRALIKRHRRSMALAHPDVLPNEATYAAERNEAFDKLLQLDNYELIQSGKELVDGKPNEVFGRHFDKYDKAMEIKNLKSRLGSLENSVKELLEEHKMKLEEIHILYSALFEKILNPLISEKISDPNGLDNVKSPVLEQLEMYRGYFKFFSPAKIEASQRTVPRTYVEAESEIFVIDRDGRAYFRKCHIDFQVPRSKKDTEQLLKAECYSLILKTENGNRFDEGWRYLGRVIMVSPVDPFLKPRKGVDRIAYEREHPLIGCTVSYVDFNLLEGVLFLEEKEQYQHEEGYSRYLLVVRPNPEFGHMYFGSINIQNISDNEGKLSEILPSAPK